MIIQSLTFENFLCYYDVKKFNLDPGLNIILGENGHGKTKFFEALEWLLNGDDSELEALFCKKALAEKEKGEQFRVRVEMVVVMQDKSIRNISRSFIVTKLAKGETSISNFEIRGHEENDSGEREPTDGNLLLDSVFPHQLRPYSMFKGEKDLNIFDGVETLSTLINAFSRAKHFKKYTDIGEHLVDGAERAVVTATKTNTKNQKAYETIEADIKLLLHEKNNLTVFRNSDEKQKKSLEKKIKDAEKHVGNAEALETINTRISKLENDRLDFGINIQEDYTNYLFDENWILVNFENIHAAFSEKINGMGIEKREKQTTYDKELGAKEGKKQLKAELLINAISLPDTVPSKAHMIEMLKDEWCKVCNREAKEGSKPYKFMNERLETYLKSQEPEDDEKSSSESLFPNDYEHTLRNISVHHEDNLADLRNVRSRIQELFDKNSFLKGKQTEIDAKIELEQTEREKIIGSSHSSGKKLSDVFLNYTGWQSDLLDCNKSLSEHLARLAQIDTKLAALNSQKDSIDTSTANTFLITTRKICRDLLTIFEDTKEAKYDEFLDKLQVLSNEVYQKLNIWAFTGTIVFNKEEIAGNWEVSVEMQENGKRLRKPNESLETSMYISILFAISELAFETQEERFPLIFDAPTSSFGLTKTGQFMDLISETSGQKILLIKDLIAADKSGKLFIKDEFKSYKRDKAFWVKLKEPFDFDNLDTINTEVKPL